MTNTEKIRILLARDWLLWKAFRLEALAQEPLAFGSTYEEEHCWEPERWQEQITEKSIYIFFIDDRPVSSVGFYQLNMLKLRHRGFIFGVYTVPEYRGKGYTQLIFEKIIQEYRQTLEQISLSCIVGDNVRSAVNFYKRLGFVSCGVSLKAFKVEGRYYDEHCLTLFLKS